jgi:hypothetical protein
MVCRASYTHEKFRSWEHLTSAAWSEVKRNRFDGWSGFVRPMLRVAVVANVG